MSNSNYLLCTVRVNRQGNAGLTQRIGHDGDDIVECDGPRQHNPQGGGEFEYMYNAKGTLGNREAHTRINGKLTY